MKLMRLATAYPVYLDAFYRSNPSVLQSSHAEQLAALNFDAFGWADFWDVALAPLGYEVQSILANAEPMQHAWARENGVAFERSRWEHDLAAAQIAAFAPEILLVEDFGRFSDEWIREVRRRTPSIRLVIGWCGAPYEGYDAFRGFDVVFSNIPEVVADLTARGMAAEHLRHAFEPRILERLPERARNAADFSFVGQVSNVPGAHQGRLRMLKRLHDDIGIVVYSPQERYSFALEFKTWAARRAYFSLRWLKARGVQAASLERIPVIGRAGRWAQAPRKAEFFKRQPASILPGMRPPVFGLEMFATLRDSKASFNAHIGLSQRTATNMRLFEATGAGGCLVTDWKEDLAELFDLDREIVCYRSIEECVEKVRWLLEHPEQRAQIARAGQARTLRDHTFAARAPRFHDLVRRHLR